MTTVNDKVKAFLFLREQIAAEKARSKKRLKTYEADMEILENSLRKDLLNQIEQTKKSTIPAAAGTVYFVKREKFSIEDRELVEGLVEEEKLPLSVFSNTLVKEEILAYIDRRRAEIAEEKGIDEADVPMQECLPPGVKYADFDEVCVRKAT